MGEVLGKVQMGASHGQTQRTRPDCRAPAGVWASGCWDFSWRLGERAVELCGLAGTHHYQIHPRGTREGLWQLIGRVKIDAGSSTCSCSSAQVQGRRASLLRVACCEVFFAWRSFELKTRRI